MEIGSWWRHNAIHENKPSLVNFDIEAFLGFNNCPRFEGYRTIIKEVEGEVS